MFDEIQRISNKRMFKDLLSAKSNSLTLLFVPLENKTRVVHSIRIAASDKSFRYCGK